MKLILQLRDADTGSAEPAPAEYQERAAARAVVFDADNNVALLHSTVHNYHKLPGGGIEEGEDIVTALHREVQEEIGCKINTLEELGMVEEWRNKIALHQISYAHVAHVVGDKGESALEENEKAEGFVTEWMPLDTAIETVRVELDRDHYLARFMTRRDLAILTEAKNLSRK
ncbi:MAG: hypothetical protein RLZZ283_28 [Candidatus Parcubacteria bacterium]